MSHILAAIMGCLLMAILMVNGDDYVTGVRHVESQYRYDITMDECLKGVGEATALAYKVCNLRAKKASEAMLVAHKGITYRLVEEPTADYYSR